MSMRSGLMALATLAALGVSACGGGGGVASSGLPQGQPSPSDATAQTVTRTYTLASAAGSYELPPLGGYSGSLALPAATVPANTRLELTSSLEAPVSVPILPDTERRRQATGTLNVYFYTTLRLSFTVTYPTLPGFSLTLPATVNPSGLQFFYAISNPTPTGGAKVQFRTEGPATVAGQTVTFAPSTTALTLQAGRSYTIAFYAISAPKVGATKIYVAGLYAFTVTTYNADGTPTTPTIRLDYPRGVAVDAAGKIYVANGQNVTSYNADGTQTTPTIAAGLKYASGVAVDAAGKIYVTDGVTGDVTTYKADGTRTTPTITGLSDPAGIAVDAAGKIYVSSGGGVVSTYNPDGSRSTPTITVEQTYPSAVAVDAAGKIYVTHQTNCRQIGLDEICDDALWTFNADGSRSTPTITLGQDLLGDQGGVAVDAAGPIYFRTDSGIMTTYNADGTQTTPTIAGVDSTGGVAVH
jgi:hypothetical protein